MPWKKHSVFKRPLFAPSFQMDGAVLAFIKRAFLGAVPTTPLPFLFCPPSQLQSPSQKSFIYFLSKTFSRSFSCYGNSHAKKGRGENFFWRESSYNEQRQRERKKNFFGKESKKNFFVPLSIRQYNAAQVADAFGLAESSRCHNHRRLAIESRRGVRSGNEPGGPLFTLPANGRHLRLFKGARQFHRPPP